MSCQCIFARNKGNMVELIGVISPYNDSTRSNKTTARRQREMRKGGCIHGYPYYRRTVLLGSR